MCPKWETQKMCVRARRNLWVSNRVNAIIDPLKSKLILHRI